MMKCSMEYDAHMDIRLALFLIKQSVPQPRVYVFVPNSVSPCSRQEKRVIKQFQLPREHENKGSSSDNASTLTT